jgi:hypothetical protein
MPKNMRMGTRLVVIGVGAASAITALMIQACGDTTDDNPVTPADAAVEAVADTSPPKEAAPPADPDAGCDTAANFTNGIPDAAIADGASTSGICVGCANTQCKAEVTGCNQNCRCQNLMGEALSCYLKNPSNATACAGGFITADQTTQGLGIALLRCLQTKCDDECAAAAFQDGGRDGGDGG